MAENGPHFQGHTEKSNFASQKPALQFQKPAFTPVHKNIGIKISKKNQIHALPT